MLVGLFRCLSVSYGVCLVSKCNCVSYFLRSCVFDVCEVFGVRFDLFDVCPYTVSVSSWSTLL